jgi:hypothetical protein
VKFHNHSSHNERSFRRSCSRLWKHLSQQQQPGSDTSTARFTPACYCFLAIHPLKTTDASFVVAQTSILQRRCDRSRPLKLLTRSGCPRAYSFNPKTIQRIQKLQLMTAHCLQMPEKGCSCTRPSWRICTSGNHSTALQVYWEMLRNIVWTT